MRKYFGWIIEHPIWGVIGAIVGLIGLVIGFSNWVSPPKNPDLEAVRTLLIDSVKEAETLVYFGRSSDLDIDSTLGGKDGWSSSVLTRISYVQGAVDSIKSHQGFSMLSDQARKFINGNNSRLEKYKDRPFLTNRRGAIRQQACGLIMTNLKEIAIIEGTPLDGDCSKEKNACKASRHNFAKTIGASSAGC
jgi:hypothetical protein